MTVLPDFELEVSSPVKAGLLLLAIGWLREQHLPSPSAASALKALGAARSQAYEYRGRILELVATLARPLGRPPVEAGPATEEATVPVMEEVLGYLMRHPGAVSAGPDRRFYSDGYRCFVLELRERFSELSLERFSRAVRVPLPTLRDWLAAPAVSAVDAQQRSGSAKPEGQNAASSLEEATKQSQIETVLHEWKAWKGPFTPFCEHLREHLRLPLGRTQIASILHALGGRRPRRRGGRSPDEIALRGEFATFFAGAQWVGDGTQIVLTLNGSEFRFNVELLVDAATAAACGAAVGDEEDSAAVIEAFRDGCRTAQKPPLAVLLDNRESNHTPEVEQTLAPTLLIPATPSRPQNKAHCEGAFGLFAQTCPELHFEATTPEELLRQFLVLLVTVWGRTLNHRPRRDRGNRSRSELYREDTPTREQILAARQALQERLERQRKARLTREARLRPHVRATITAAFERLGLADPRGRLLAAIARYPLDAILAGIATFEGKKTAGTLPDGADGRYLLGIVRNIAEHEEGVLVAEALLRARLNLRDASLAGLESHRRSLQAQHSDPLARLARLVDAALATERVIERHFWLLAAADELRPLEASENQRLFRFAATRIHAHYGVPNAQRQAAIRLLARHAVPLQ